MVQVGLARCCSSQHQPHKQPKSWTLKMITLSKTTKTCLNLLIAASLVFGFAASPAMAEQNDDTPAEVTVKSLKADGYKCETVSIGFVECTKAGETTQWCSSGTCVDKPRRTSPIHRHTAPNGGGVFIEPSSYTPISDAKPVVLATNMIMAR